MSHTLRGLTFDAPNDFQADECVLSLRAPMPDLKSPLTMNKQLIVRPNLIVHRRVVQEGATVEMLCGEICAELAGAMSNMEQLRTTPFQYKDGAVGMLISFDFAAGRGERNDVRVTQFQALRLDGTLLTTLTLSVDATTLTEETKKHWQGVLASASLVEHGL